MEWVETTGRTVEEAKEKALDQLGVHEEDAEFEVVEEPKAGLFGRVRGEARVRARVRPTQSRQKIERRDRKRSGDRNGRSKSDGQKADGAKQGGQQRGPKKPATPKSPQSATAATPKSTQQEKEHDVDPRQVGEEASRFMQGLLDAFGATGTVELVEDGDDLEVRVHGEELGLLVGPGGNTLMAIQDLTRVASQRRLGDQDTRLRVDIAGYRERRKEALGRFAQKVAEEVVSTGQARRLEPMNSADRKIVHDTLIEVAGVSTRSEGEDPKRRVVVEPATAE
mgnify:CR=1 FL=1